MGLIRGIIEFLIGFFIVPILVGIVGTLSIMFLLPILGIAGSEAQFMAYSQILLLILKGLVLLLLFLTGKFIALGYLASLILDYFGAGLLNYFGVSVG